MGTKVQTTNSMNRPCACVNMHTWHTLAPQNACMLATVNPALLAPNGE